MFLTAYVLYIHCTSGHSINVNRRKPRCDLLSLIWQILRFCGPMVPVYTAVTLLLACGGQLSSILKTRRAADMSQVVGNGLQPHKVNLPVYVLHILLG